MYSINSEKAKRHESRMLELRVSNAREERPTAGDDDKLYVNIC